jgi:ATP adenylyltransferase
MSNPPLHAPWRMQYIRTLDKPDAGKCFMCEAATATSPEDRKSRLVLWDTPRSVVVINRFPYTNGHLLVCPKAHKAELEDLSDDELLDLQKQTAIAAKLLKRAVSCQGLNVGINLGRCAGAGVPGHIHQHIVPRWAGDTNFMSVVAEVRVVPQAISQLYDELIKVKAEMSA